MLLIFISQTYLVVVQKSADHQCALCVQLPHPADVFISVAAHEISVCVLSGRGHISTNQRLQSRHINSIYSLKIAPPICLLWQQPRR